MSRSARAGSGSGTGGAAAWTDIPVWLAYGFLVFTALSWAGSSVAGRAASGNVPPMTLAFIRWFAAFLLFLPFGGAALWRQRRVVGRHFWLMCAFALFGVVGFTVPYYVGLQYTEAVNAALMNGTGPVMILLLAYGMVGTPVSGAQWGGITVALAGTVAIVFRGDPASIMALEVGIGDALVLVCFFSWSMYTVMLRWRPDGLDPTVFLIVLFGLASLMMLPMYLSELAAGRRFELSAGNLTIIGYAALFPSAIAYICWNLAVNKLGPGPVSYTQYLIPVFGVMLSILILGESLQTYHLVGIGCIFTGIYLATARGRPNRPETD